jgi:hypothetical protein
MGETLRRAQPRSAGYEHLPTKRKPSRRVPPTQQVSARENGKAFTRSALLH